MPDRKKILLFTDWYEPGFKAGGPIQSSKNIVNLLSDVFQFFVFTSDRDLSESSPYPGIPTDEWLPQHNGSSILYASPAFLKTANIRKVLQDISPDIVYLNSMFSSGFSLMPLWILRAMNYSGRIILAPRGMLNTSAVSRKKWKKKIFLSLFSLSRMSKKILFHATDLQEQADIQRYFRDTAQVKLLSNIPNVNSEWLPRNKQPGMLNCVFISRIHPIKNLLYAINVIKSLAGCTVWFDVYGTVEDETYFQKCRKAVSDANTHIHINFKGPIANVKIFQTLENYHVFFLPTQGENFGHVIFEALSSGCVVLISDKTPWKNIEQNNAGWALALNDPRGFSARLKELCGLHENEFNIKSKAAFNYAADYIASMQLKNRYTELFEGGQS